MTSVWIFSQVGDVKPEAAEAKRNARAAYSKIQCPGGTLTLALAICVAHVYGPKNMGQTVPGPDTVNRANKWHHQQVAAR